MNPAPKLPVGLADVVDTMNLRERQVLCALLAVATPQTDEQLIERCSFYGNGGPWGRPRAEALMLLGVALHGVKVKIRAASYAVVRAGRGRLLVKIPALSVAPPPARSTVPPVVARAPDECSMQPEAFRVMTGERPRRRAARRPRRSEPPAA